MYCFTITAVFLIIVLFRISVRVVCAPSLKHKWWEGAQEGGKHITVSM